MASARPLDFLSPSGGFLFYRKHLESVLDASNSRKTAELLAKQIQNQIEDSERQIVKTSGIKSTLYENMVSGLLTKEDYKTLKTRYSTDETRLRDAVATLETERDKALDGSAERLQWMENFRQFQGLHELDRRTVVNLIQSIRVTGKTELDITFNYQAEYEQALDFLKGEVAA